MLFVDTAKLGVIERLPGWYGRYFHSPSMTFAHYDFVLKGDSNPFLYDPDFLQREIQDFCQSHPATPCVILQEIDVSDR